VAAQKAKSNALGYLSIPISTVNGSCISENIKIAGEVKERLRKAMEWPTLPPGGRRTGFAYRPQSDAPAFRIAHLV